MLCAACLSRLGAARVLAAPASAMRDAVLCIAYSGLGAALLLAPLPSTMRLTVERAASSSRLGAARVLTPPAPAVHAAEPRVA